MQNPLDFKNKSQFSAFTNDCLGNLDATDLCNQLKTGKVSIEEVTTAAISRAQRSQPIIGAMVCDTFELANANVKANGKVGDFQSIPIFLKDNMDLKGFPTRFGSRAMPRNVKQNNSALTDQLQSIGLNIIGKSTTPPFGFGCSTEFEDETPPTRNPWNLEYSAGGSSGGSCALVASGVVPIAHANDGGGSIRIPAAMCGIVGLKPSRGRLAVNERTKSMPINIISDGVVTRTVRDTANFYLAAEKIYKPAGLKPIGKVEGPSANRLKIAFIFDSVFTKADDETRKTVSETVLSLQQAGHYVEEIAMPQADQFGDDFTLYWSLLAFSVEYFGKPVFGKEFDSSKLDPLTLGLSKQFLKQFWKAPFAISRLRKSAVEALERTKNFNVVVSPVIAKVTPKLGFLNPSEPFPQLMARLKSYVGYTPVANATGAPAISLPMGMSTGGLPIGVQISAPVGEERMLLELAFELEQIKPWKTISEI